MSILFVPKETSVRVCTIKKFFLERDSVVRQIVFFKFGQYRSSQIIVEPIKFNLEVSISD